MGEEPTIVAITTAACVLPLVVAIVLGWTLWLTHPTSKRSGLVASLTLVSCLGLLIWAFVESASTGDVEASNLLTIASFRDGTFGLGLLVDQLSFLMGTTVLAVSSCVAIYATGYLHEDATDHVHDHEAGSRRGRFPWFFCCLLAFVTAMLGLVFSPNLFQTFVCWELVGACSYFLIGFYKERPAAGPAATKAFVVNRVGDVGFLIGIMILWTSQGSLSFAELTELVAVEGAIAAPLLAAATLGIFAGCVGKSAQFPLQIWLPDAMAGPTPVSALVHSATMVAAGVYLVARTYVLFPPDALMVVAYGGAVTLFLAALFALAADDIKRILAWSTVSQLGYMMLALGLGGLSAGVLHLLTHAFFKSLLFLSAGSVIYACHHEQSLKKLGGLWRRMPITAALCGVGAIAICGLAFSGFHSKDAILAQAMAFVRVNPQHVLLFAIPMATAGLTAVYMGRLYFGVFLGSPRSHGAEEAREVPVVMWLPMVVLVAVTATMTWGGEDGPLMHATHELQPALADGTGVFSVAYPDAETLHAVHATAGFIAYLLAAAGLIAAWLAFARRPATEEGWLGWTPRLRRFLTTGGLADELYELTVVEPAVRTGSGLTHVDRKMIDRFVDGSAATMVRLAKWDDGLDRSFVDGMVNGIGRLIHNGGISLSRLQTGSIRQYVLALSIGLLSAFALLFTFLPPG